MAGGGVNKMRAKLYFHDKLQKKNNHGQEGVFYFLVDLCEREKGINLDSIFGLTSSFLIPRIRPY